MTPQEQELLNGLIDRLRQAGPQQKDAEAEALIRRAVAAQPDIPYLLAQSVLVQDFALANANARMQELEAKLAEAQGARPAPAAAAGSFLGGMAGGRGSVPAVGPWASRSQASPAGAQPAPHAQQAQPPMMAPQRGAPAAMPPQAGGGGFLRQAMATAAGVAGGALLFQGIQSMFSGHGQPGAAAAAQPSPTQAAAEPAAAAAPSQLAEAEPRSGLADANYAQDMSDDGMDYGADMGGDDMGGGDSDMF